MSASHSGSSSVPSPAALRRVVVLLRGINVGGRKSVRMSDLTALLQQLEYHHPRTLLQSGNAVVQVSVPAGADAAAWPAAMAARIEEALARHLKVECDVFVRTEREWAGLVAANPFVDAAVADPSHLLAMVLSSAPERAAIRALQSSITGREVVRHADRCLYIFYAEGIGRSTLTGAVIERRLDVRGTARNWNTVLKLQALLTA